MRLEFAALRLTSHLKVDIGIAKQGICFAVELNPVGVFVDLDELVEVVEERVVLFEGLVQIR